MHGLWLAGTLALLVARPLLPAGAQSVVQGDGLLFVMLAILLLLGWALTGLLKRKLEIRLAPVDLAVAVFFLLVAASGTAAIWREAPRASANALWEWVGLGVGYVLVRQLVRHERELRAMVAVMIGLAAALSLYGIYQYFYEIDIAIAQFEAAGDPQALLRELRIPLDLEAFRQRLYSREPYATFALANSLAGFLATWLIVLLGVAASGLPATGGRSRWATWGGYLLPAAPVVLCLILTKSRSAWLATAAGVLAIALCWRLSPVHRGRALAVAGGLGLLGAVAMLLAVMLGAVDTEVATESLKSLAYRFQYWQGAWQIILERPLTGCGPGNFRDWYTQFKAASASEEVAEPHNFLVEIWATAGTTEVVAFLVGTALFLRNLLRQTHRAEVGSAGDSADSGLPLALCAGGLAGFPLAWVVGATIGHPVSGPVLVGGMMVTAGGLLVLRRFIAMGRLQPLLLGVAVFTLLVHLLAAGGISFPSVAGTLWMLLAAAVTLGDLDKKLALGNAGRLLATGLIFALGAAAYFTSYGPVAQCRVALLKADVRGKEALQAAAAADPWSEEPPLRLAEIELSEWKQTRSRQDLLEFEQQIDRVLLLRPRWAGVRFSLGRLYDDIYVETKDPAFALRAARAYRSATALYPNSALYQARFAVALEAISEREQAQQAAERAVQLHAGTPHEDKKLSSELLRKLQRIMTQE